MLREILGVSDSDQDVLLEDEHHNQFTGPEIHEEGSPRPFKFVSSQRLEDADEQEVMKECTYQIEQIENLLDLTAGELISYIWHPSLMKAMQLDRSLFPYLPDCPIILESRFVDASKISSFLRSAVLILKRKEVQLSLFNLRSLFVSSAAIMLSKKAEAKIEFKGTMCKWSISSSANDFLLIAEKKEYSEAPLSTVSVPLPLSGDIPFTSLNLLQKELDKCIEVQSTQLAQPWDATEVVSRCLDYLKRNANDNKSETDSLILEIIIKCAFVSSNISLVLFVFQWFLKNDASYFRNMSIKNLKNLLQLMRRLKLSRIRINLPLNKEGELLSINHSFLRLNVEGCCLVNHGHHSMIIVLTSGGTFKSLAQSPFTILCTNSATQVCRLSTVMVEENNIIALSQYNKSITYIDTHTLDVLKVESMQETKRVEFYIGKGNCLSPHFLNPIDSRKHLKLDGTELYCDPVELQLAPTSYRSFSVQFSVLPMNFYRETFLTLVSISKNGICLLQVTLSLFPLKNVYIVQFLHGKSVIAEVEEYVNFSICKWVQWSATLCLHAKKECLWHVYRNGILQHCKAVSGPFSFVSSSGIHAHVVVGTFSGFLSSLNVWNEEKSIDDMQFSQFESDNISDRLLTIPMSEGIGCTLNSRCGLYSWYYKKNSFSWERPPMMLPLLHSGEKKNSDIVIPWKPRDNFFWYVVGSDEVAIIEKNVTTWLNLDGVIVEQDSSFIEPSNCFFIDRISGKVVLTTKADDQSRIITFDGLNLGKFEYDHLKHASVKLENLCRLYDSSGVCSFQELMIAIGYQCSSFAVQKNRLQFSFQSFFNEIRSSPLSLIQFLKTLGSIIHRNDELIFLLISTVSCLLRTELRSMRNACPNDIIQEVMNFHKEMLKWKSEMFLSTHLSMVCDYAIYSVNELYEVSVMECTDNRFKLDIILSCESLEEVRILLSPAIVGSLTCLLIRENEKKSLMQLLGKLKEGCEREAEKILSTCSSVDETDNALNSTFKPSISTLHALLTLLGQKSSQWHIIGIALLNSLTRKILQHYEAIDSVNHREKDNRNEQRSIALLKRTAVGTVVFPSVYFVSKMHFDHLILPEVASALESTSRCLAHFLGKVKQDNNVTKWRCVSFNESHSMTITPSPISGTGKDLFEEKLNLSHAKSIKVSMSLTGISLLNSKEKGVGGKTVQLFLVGNDLRRYSAVFSLDKEGKQNEILSSSFPVGGLLHVVTREPEVFCGHEVVIAAQVELVMEKTFWIKELHQAISKCLLSISLEMISCEGKSSPQIERNSFLRGGLLQYSNFPSAVFGFSGVQNHNASDSLPALLPDTLQHHTSLCQLAGGESGELMRIWEQIYAKMKIPFGEKLPRVMRWCCTAVAWYLLKLVSNGSCTYGSSRGIQDCLESALLISSEIMKRQAISLREAIQREQEDAIITRARFVLMDLSPPHVSTASIATYQQTESSIFGPVGKSQRINSSRFPSQQGIKDPQADLWAGSSWRRMEPLSLSASRVTRVSAATNVFKRNAGRSTASVEAEVVRFLIQGSVGIPYSTGFNSAPDTSSHQSPGAIPVASLTSSLSVPELTTILTEKQAIAKGRSKGYDILSYLSNCFLQDEAVLQEICLTILKCRRKLEDPLIGLNRAEKPDFGTSKSMNKHGLLTEQQSAFLDSQVPTSPLLATPSTHYLNGIIGCGMKMELDHQKSVCVCVRRLLKAASNFLNQSRDFTSFPCLLAVSVCALLCHPWDSVDFAILHPTDIFLFLGGLLTKSLKFYLVGILLPEALQNTSEAAPEEKKEFIKKNDNGSPPFDMSKGLTNWNSTHYIIENNFLFADNDGVNVVDGDLQGIHVEGSSVRFSARRFWKLSFSREDGEGVKKMEKCVPGASPSTVPSDSFPDSAVGETPVGVGNDFSSFHFQDTPLSSDIPSLAKCYPNVYYFEIVLNLLTPESHVEMGINPLGYRDCICDAVCGTVRDSYSPPATSLASPAVHFHSNGYVCSSDCLTDVSETMMFSEPWRSGDCIGCGVFSESGEIFFSKNGCFLGIAAKCSTESEEGKVFPFLSITSPDGNSVVLANFGVERSFRLDLTTIHGSFRHQYLTCSTTVDACFMTTEYLLTRVYQNLTAVDEHPSVSKDSVSQLLEQAVTFLRDQIVELVELMRKNQASWIPEKASEAKEVITRVILRFFHCVSTAVECFDLGEYVTLKTPAIVFQLCVVALTTSHMRAIQLAAAQCIGLMQEKLSDQRFEECVKSCPCAHPEHILQSIFQLTRARIVKENSEDMVPRWEGGVTVARGSGSFFGEAPLPSTGTHRVGFRITRHFHRRLPAKGFPVNTGASLGGNYFIGLSRGKPASFVDTSEFLHRNDMFVLEDTGSSESVPNLLLSNRSIPRNKYYQVFGDNDEVWVEWKADLGEILFYCGETCLGLVFAGLPALDDLFPFVFLYNDNASCEILTPTVVPSGPVEDRSVLLRRSIAVHLLQKLHTSTVFAAPLFQMLQRSIALLKGTVEESWTALAVLGGESSYHLCHHSSYGLVVVMHVDDTTRRAAVYSSTDDEKHIFVVNAESLRPTFVKTPIYMKGSVESLRSVSLLCDTLDMVLEEASGANVLQREEATDRIEISAAFDSSLQQMIFLFWCAFLRSTLNSHEGDAIHTTTSSIKDETFSVTLEDPLSKEDFFPPASPASIGDNPPIVVERWCSTPSVHVPSSLPSIGVSSPHSPSSVIRGSIIPSDSPLQKKDWLSFGVVIGKLSKNAALYVGCFMAPNVSELNGTGVMKPPVLWGLSNVDPCPAELGVMSRGEGGLFVCCGTDELEKSVSRLSAFPNTSCRVVEEGDFLSFSFDKKKGIVRCRRAGTAGMNDVTHISELLLSEAEMNTVGGSIPHAWSTYHYQPFVCCGPETVVIFTCEDGWTLPSRQVFPASLHAPSVDVIHRKGGTKKGSALSVSDAVATQCAYCKRCASTFGNKNCLFFKTALSTEPQRIPVEGPLSRSPPLYLCSDCFYGWKFPLVPFSMVAIRSKGHEERSEEMIEERSNWLVLPYAPELLRTNDLVEFLDSTTRHCWSSACSINVLFSSSMLPSAASPRPITEGAAVEEDSAGEVAVALSNAAAAISGVLQPYDFSSTVLRVDWVVELFSTSSTAGEPLDAMEPFIPTWSCTPALLAAAHRSCDMSNGEALLPCSERSTTRCRLPSRWMVTTSNIIPPHTAGVYGSIAISADQEAFHQNEALFFVGVTALTVAEGTLYYGSEDGTITCEALEQMKGDHKLVGKWGSWQNGKMYDHHDEVEENGEAGCHVHSSSRSVGEEGEAHIARTIYLWADAPNALMAVETDLQRLHADSDYVSFSKLLEKRRYELELNRVIRKRGKVYEHTEVAESNVEVSLRFVFYSTVPCILSTIEKDGIVVRQRRLGEPCSSPTKPSSSLPPIKVIAGLVHSDFSFQHFSALQKSVSRAEEGTLPEVNEVPSSSSPSTRTPKDLPHHVVPSNFLLSDTIEHTEMLYAEDSPTERWSFSPHAYARGGRLMALGDEMTLLVTTLPSRAAHDEGIRSRSYRVEVFGQGKRLAWKEVKTFTMEDWCSQRLAVWMRVPGLSARFTPPVFSVARIGRVKKVWCDGCIGLVKEVVQSHEVACWAVVRRDDVRAVASPIMFGCYRQEEGPKQILAVHPKHQKWELFQVEATHGGTLMVYPHGGFHNEMRGGRGSEVRLPGDCEVYVIENQGLPVPSLPGYYQRLLPSTPPQVLKLAPGRGQYQKGESNIDGYTGVMFDCHVSSPIELLRIQVFSTSKKSHHFDVYFKYGSHAGSESCGSSWLSLFSGSIDVPQSESRKCTSESDTRGVSGTVMSIPFNPPRIIAPGVFALYIHADSPVMPVVDQAWCYDGECGNRLDTDSGTLYGREKGCLTIFVGKCGKGQLFTGTCSVKGFNGALVYRKRSPFPLPFVDVLLGHIAFAYVTPRVSLSPLDSFSRVVQESSAVLFRVQPPQHIEEVENGFCFDINVLEECVWLSGLALPVRVTKNNYCAGFSEGALWNSPVLNMEETKNVRAALLHIFVRFKGRRPNRQTEVMSTYSNEWSWLWSTQVSDEQVQGGYIYLKRLKPFQLLRGYSEICVHIDTSDPFFNRTSPFVFLCPHKEDYLSRRYSNAFEISRFFGSVEVRVPYSPHSVKLLEQVKPKPGTTAHALYTSYGSEQALLEGMVGEVRELTSVCSSRFEEPQEEKGIMFDVQANRNILVDEICGTSGKSTSCVRIKVWWRKGSMVGCEEKASPKWNLLSDREVNFYGRSLFSTTGSLSTLGAPPLLLREGERYSFFIQSDHSSFLVGYAKSCKSIPLAVPIISDGILSLCVGCTLEEFGSPKHKKCVFSGKIVYRSLSVRDGHAFFSLGKAFLLTRLLLSLLSCVDSISGEAEHPIVEGCFEDSAAADRGNRVCEKRVSSTAISRHSIFHYIRSHIETSVSKLVLFPRPFVPDLDDTEYFLSCLLQQITPSDLRGTSLSMALASPEPTPLLASFGDGSLAWHVPSELSAEEECEPHSSSSMKPTLVMVTRKDGVQDEESRKGAANSSKAATEEYRHVRVLSRPSSLISSSSSTTQKVQLADLLPLVTCWRCHSSAICASHCCGREVSAEALTEREGSCTFALRQPFRSETERTVAVVASGMTSAYPVTPSFALYCARKLLDGKYGSMEDILQLQTPAMGNASAMAPAGVVARFDVFLPVISPNIIHANGPFTEANEAPFVFTSPPRYLEACCGLMVWYQVHFTSLSSRKFDETKEALQVVLLGRWMCETSPPPVAPLPELDIFWKVSLQLVASDSAEPLLTTLLPPPSHFSLSRIASMETPAIQEIGRLSLPLPHCAVFQRSLEQLSWEVRLEKVLSFIEPRYKAQHSRSSPALKSLTWRGTEGRETSMDSQSVTWLKPVKLASDTTCCFAYLCVDDYELSPGCSDGSPTEEHLYRGVKLVCQCRNTSVGEVHEGCGAEASDPMSVGELMSTMVYLLCGELALLHISSSRITVLDRQDKIIGQLDLTISMAERNDSWWLEIGVSCEKHHRVSLSLLSASLGLSEIYRTYYQQRRYSIESTNRPLDNEEAKGMSCVKCENYLPVWEIFDVMHLQIGSDVDPSTSAPHQHIRPIGPGPKMALGNTLPSRRDIISFSIRIHRADRRDGQTLDGGHFIGLALASFTPRPGEGINFRTVKTYTDSLWAIQDVQDIDSMPHQLPLPPLHETEDVCFFSGMQVTFLYYSNEGRVEVLRGSTNMPKVVFDCIPPQAQLRPFVLLDSELSTASLSSSTIGLQPPEQESHEKALSSTHRANRRCRLSVILEDGDDACLGIGGSAPLNGLRQSAPQLLSESQVRGKDFDTLCERFPMWRLFVMNFGPPAWVRFLASEWPLSDMKTPMNLYLSLLVGCGIRKGWYEQTISLHPPQCVMDTLTPNEQRVVEMLRAICASKGQKQEGEHTMIPHIISIGKEASRSTHHADVAELKSASYSKLFTFFLPQNTVVAPGPMYDTGCEDGAEGSAIFTSPLVHLLTWSSDESQQISYRTLFCLSAVEEIQSTPFLLHRAGALTPHPHIGVQSHILTSTHPTGMCAVVLERWFDMTLQQLMEIGSFHLSVNDFLFVLRSILCALEHYHLHGKIHGRISMRNVLVSVSHGRVVDCVLTHYFAPTLEGLQGTTTVIEKEKRAVPIPSPFLMESGPIDLAGELSSDPRHDIWAVLYMMESVLHSCVLSDTRLSSLPTAASMQPTLAVMWREVAHDKKFCTSFFIDRHAKFLQILSPQTTHRKKRKNEFALHVYPKRFLEGLLCSTHALLLMNSHGMLFSIFAYSPFDVFITKLSMLISCDRMLSDNVNSLPIRIFIKHGTYVGSERSGKDWTILNSVVTKEKISFSITEGFSVFDGFVPIQVKSGECVSFLIQCSHKIMNIASCNDSYPSSPYGDVVRRNEHVGLTVGQSIESASSFSSKEAGKSCLIVGSVSYLTDAHDEGEPRSNLLKTIPESSSFYELAQESETERQLGYSHEPQTVVLENKEKREPLRVWRRSFLEQQESQIQLILMKGGEVHKGCLGLRILRNARAYESLVLDSSNKLSWYPDEEWIDDSGTMTEVNEEGASQAIQEEIARLDEAVTSYTKLYNQKMVENMCIHTHYLPHRLIPLLFLSGKKKSSSKGGEGAPLEEVDFRAPPLQWKAGEALVSENLVHSSMVTVWSDASLEWECQLVLEEEVLVSLSSRSSRDHGGVVQRRVLVVFECSRVSGGLSYLDEDEWKCISHPSLRSDTPLRVELHPLQDRQLCTSSSDARRSELDDNSVRIFATYQLSNQTDGGRVPTLFQQFPSASADFVHRPSMQWYEPQQAAVAQREGRLYLSSLYFTVDYMAIQEVTLLRTSANTGPSSRPYKAHIKPLLEQGSHTWVVAQEEDERSSIEAVACCVASSYAWKEHELPLLSPQHPKVEIVDGVKIIHSWVSPIRSLPQPSDVPQADPVKYYLHSIMFSAQTSHRLALRIRSPCHGVAVKVEICEIHRLHSFCTFPFQDIVRAAYPLHYRPTATCGTPADAMKRVSGHMDYCTTLIIEAHLNVGCVYVHSSDGIFYNAFNARQQPYQDVQCCLSFTFSTPGSSVELLHWETAPAQMASVEVNFKHDEADQAAKVGLHLTEMRADAPLVQGDESVAPLPMALWDLSQQYTAVPPEGPLPHYMLFSQRTASRMVQIISSYAHFLVGQVLMNGAGQWEWASKESHEERRSESWRDSGRLHRFLSYTLGYERPGLMEDVVLSSIKKSVGLIGFSMLYLLQPRACQTQAGVQTSLSALQWLVFQQTKENLREVLSSSFGSSLTLLFLHLAVMHRGIAREKSLRCASALLENLLVPLPAPHILRHHLKPIVSRVIKKCKSRFTPSSFVSIGAPLLTSLVVRVASAEEPSWTHDDNHPQSPLDRVSLLLPGANPCVSSINSIPYSLIYWARFLVQYFALRTPQPLPPCVEQLCAPPSFVVDQLLVKKDRVILMFSPFTSQMAESNQFLPNAEEPQLDHFSCKPYDTIRVVLSRFAQGPLVVGWNRSKESHCRPSAEDSSTHETSFSEVMDAQLQRDIAIETDPETGFPSPLPDAGLVVKNRRVFWCQDGQIVNEDEKSSSVKDGDIIEVTAFYDSSIIKMHVESSASVSFARREVCLAHIDYTGNLPSRGVVGLPFVSFCKGSVSSLDFGRNIDYLMLFNEVFGLSSPKVEQDVDAAKASSCCTSSPPQSLEFYAELNQLVQKIKLPIDFTLSPAACGEKNEDGLYDLDSMTHIFLADVAPYPRVLRVLQTGLLEKIIPVSDLRPYLGHLFFFDQLLLKLLPFIDFTSSSELPRLFFMLDKLLSPSNRSKLQNMVLSRLPRHTELPVVKVTIHPLLTLPSREYSVSQSLKYSYMGQLYSQLSIHPSRVFDNVPLFKVVLSGFGSTDEGGPYREVLYQLAREINTPNPFFSNFQLNPLFYNAASHDALPAVMPHPNIHRCTQGPSVLYFFGKLLAVYFRCSEILPLILPPLFWKLLRQPRVFNSAGADKEKHDGCCELLWGSKSEFGWDISDVICFNARIAEEIAPAALLHFTIDEIEESYPGCMAFWEQQHGKRMGSSDSVLTNDQAEIVSRCIWKSMIARFDAPMHCIRKGFNSVLPIHVLRVFQPEEIEKRICGVPKLSVEDFLKHCIVTRLTPDASESFLRFVAKISDEDRGLLLRFTTGQSRLPLPLPIQVIPISATDTLPTSGTCCFTLRLPHYSSFELMEERILYAIRQCNSIDADTITANEMIVMP